VLQKHKSGKEGIVNIAQFTVGIAYATEFMYSTLNMLLLYYAAEVVPTYIN